ncbi:class I SAM-dependent DNA methyltransferase [Desulfosudis oleivorans]|uniref:Methyltransferase type 11 n=1 Tax=Desulfosudis oleivorans (strain DSM 6200 / JCM 39069 / Hxd3) TaxID=96561 RepID=A8ZT14_DESOH|nr:methyltransferase domain-containing protein [Desulfosudis oleivorans]ABW66178.1 Methyltransferase type 11 [Desulfosudis oleivorans Hxd3]
MTSTPYQITFPKGPPADAGQGDQCFCVTTPDGNRQTIRCHDYGLIYSLPGLYEQVFCDRLACVSPQKVADVLEKVVGLCDVRVADLRVLDLGAGNGLVGEALSAKGVGRLVGADIIPEARMATERDRPGIYDAYYVTDFCRLSQEETAAFQSWSFNCLITVGALGFDDIPPRAFVAAYNMVETGGWVAFNIREDFLDKTDTSGFAGLVREMLFSRHMTVHHLERYRHRLSTDGRPLFYLAVAGRKRAHLPETAL